MTPDGTVSSIGPSLKLGKDFSSPRISIAFSCMCQFFLFFHDFAQKMNDLPIAQARFGAFPNRFLQQFPGFVLLDLAAAAMSAIRDKCAQPLAPVDNSFTLKLLISALDRDDADEKVFR